VGGRRLPVLGVCPKLGIGGCGWGCCYFTALPDYKVVSKNGSESSVLPAEHFLADRLQLLLHVLLRLEGELCIESGTFSNYW